MSSGAPARTTGEETAEALQAGVQQHVQSEVDKDLADRAEALAMRDQPSQRPQIGANVETFHKGLGAVPKSTPLDVSPTRQAHPGFMLKSPTLEAPVKTPRHETSRTSSTARKTLFSDRREEFVDDDDDQTSVLAEFDKLATSLESSIAARSPRARDTLARLDTATVNSGATAQYGRQLATGAQQSDSAQPSYVPESDADARHEHNVLDAAKDVDAGPTMAGTTVPGTHVPGTLPPLGPLPGSLYAAAGSRQPVYDRAKTGMANAAGQPATGTTSGPPAGTAAGGNAGSLEKQSPEGKSDTLERADKAAAAAAERAAAAAAADAAYVGKGMSDGDSVYEEVGGAENVNARSSRSRVSATGGTAGGGQRANDTDASHENARDVEMGQHHAHEKLYRGHSGEQTKYPQDSHFAGQGRHSVPRNRPESDQGARTYGNPQMGRHDYTGYKGADHAEEHARYKQKSSNFQDHGTYNKAPGSGPGTARSRGRNDYGRQFPDMTAPPPDMTFHDEVDRQRSAIRELQAQVQQLKLTEARLKAEMDEQRTRQRLGATLAPTAAATTSGTNTMGSNTQPHQGGSENTTRMSLTDGKSVTLNVPQVSHQTVQERMLEMTIRDPNMDLPERERALAQLKNIKDLKKADDRLYEVPPRPAVTQAYSMKDLKIMIGETDDSRQALEKILSLTKIYNFDDKTLQSALSVGIRGDAHRSFVKLLEHTEVREVFRKLLERYAQKPTISSALRKNSEITWDSSKETVWQALTRFDETMDDLRILLPVEGREAMLEQRRRSFIERIAGKHSRELLLEQVKKLKEGTVWTSSDLARHLEDLHSLDTGTPVLASATPRSRFSSGDTVHKDYLHRVRSRSPIRHQYFPPSAQAPKEEKTFSGIVSQDSPMEQDNMSVPEMDAKSKTATGQSGERAPGRGVPLNRTTEGDIINHIHCDNSTLHISGVTDRQFRQRGRGGYYGSQPGRYNSYGSPRGRGYDGYDRYRDARYNGKSYDNRSYDRRYQDRRHGDAHASEKRVTWKDQEARKEKNKYSDSKKRKRDEDPRSQALTTEASN